ncbi:MAG: hypothetical protein AAEF61_07575 [Candidatus Pseudothioglobus sp.]|jgi:hypothetical protein|nr:hypothetical protein [Candidatus Thioglobus sp.]HIL44801.1 hypothetical protein [Candidatus Thioglobus sp.]
MDIQSICHVFLILFGGFFAIQLTFNSQKFATDLRMDSPQAAYALKPAGFLMSGTVLMLIVTFFQIGVFERADTPALLAAMGLFCTFAFIWNMGQFLKVWPTFDGADHDIKNAIRPLIPLVAIIIYFWA